MMSMTVAQLDQAHVRRTLTRAVVFPTILMIIVIGILLGQIDYLLSTAARVDRSDRVIGQMLKTQRLLVDMETGLRGYLVTGSSDFLEPYTLATASIDAALDTLARLCADSQIQLQNLDRIHSSYIEWSRYANMMISLRERGEAYQEYAINAEGKRLMDGLRAQTGRFLTTEEARRNELTQAAQLATWVVSISCILMVLLSGGTLVFFTRRQLIAVARNYGRMLATTQEQAQALEAERALLAQRVDERTAELSMANAEQSRTARLKDEFLANMSHELRTPLNAILGLAEALQEQVYGPINQEHMKALISIEDSGRHLLALINDILDLSKIEAGKVVLDLGPVSVESVCRASLRLVQQAAYKKHLRIVTSIDAQVTTIQADERRLKQILVNLLTNATKFTPEGGTIGLETVGNTMQQVVRLTVWDSGVGIAPDDLARIFQPFVQADSALPRQQGGTGLGLALVCRMVELHGGSITVESTVGQGSSFTVSLPWTDLAEASRSGSVPETDAESDRSPLPEGAHGEQQAPELPTVLLAEDNETNITTLSDYLRAKGYTVVVARNGIEATMYAREVHPAVIVMDLQMPGMDGLEAIRYIRATAELAHIPIIALTALAMPGDRQRCLAAGANDYLSKPISLKGLVTAIKEQTRRGQAG